jgi:hypothetical protein
MAAFMSTVMNLRAVQKGSHLTDELLLTARGRSIRVLTRASIYHVISGSGNTENPELLPCRVFGEKFHLFLVKKEIHDCPY